jgi:hypothetical protein
MVLICNRRMPVLISVKEVESLKRGRNNLKTRSPPVSLRRGEGLSPIQEALFLDSRDH